MKNKIITLCIVVLLLISVICIIPFNHVDEEKLKEAIPKPRLIQGPVQQGTSEVAFRTSGLNLWEGV